MIFAFADSKERRSKTLIVTFQHVTTNLCGSHCVLSSQVAGLHANPDLMHGPCMSAGGVRARSCSHGSNHARQRKRPR